MQALAGMRAGLCDSCVHQQLVRTGRGSTFSLCRRSKTDSRYPKYPRLPVERCPGYEPSAAVTSLLGDHGLAVLGDARLRRRREIVPLNEPEGGSSPPPA